jgi:hypothetical protein
MRRFVFRLSSVLGAAGTALFLPLLALSASADINGPCSATLNGANVNDIDSSGSALEVDHNSNAQAVMTANQQTGGFEYHRVQLEFAGRRWTVSDQVDGGDPTWTETVKVSDYATYGVGLYKVIGYGRLARGEECVGIAYVKVTGKNPLSTVAGGSAAAAGAAAAGGLAAAGVANARPRKPEEAVIDAIDNLGKAEEAAQDKAAMQQATREGRERVRIEQRIATANVIQEAFGSSRLALYYLLGCFTLALFLPLLVVMGTMSGSGSAIPAGDPGRLPRAPWVPRITLLGVVSGLLLGASVVVLLQQFAVLFPTLGVAIAGIVLGLLAGVIVPSLARLIPVRRVNRRIASLEAEIRRPLSGSPPSAAA